MRLVSATMLIQYMGHRKMTNRGLAAATGQVAKRAIIAHLRSGSRTTCSVRTALAIEEALGAPSGLLFAPAVPNTQLGTVSRKAA